MTEDYTTLALFFKGWDVYQQYLTKAIAPLSSEQLTLQAAPNLRSTGVLASHIISARVWWFHYVMGEGSAYLAPMVEWDEDG